MLVTHVIDSGVGISGDKLKQLFKVFESINQEEIDSHLVNTLKNTSSPNVTSGEGIGLYLSHNIAKFFGGQI